MEVSILAGFIKAAANQTIERLEKKDETSLICSLLKFGMMLSQ